MQRSGMMRCRPGIVTKWAFGTVPDQRCTASRTRYVLHRIRDTRRVEPIVRRRDRAYLVGERVIDARDGRCGDAAVFPSAAVHRRGDRDRARRNRSALALL